MVIGRLRSSITLRSQLVSSTNLFVSLRYGYRLFFNLLLLIGQKLLTTDSPRILRRLTAQP